MLQCDCCKSVLDVSEKGQESALFIDLRAQGRLRCPACNGYLLKQIHLDDPKKEKDIRGKYIEYVHGFGQVHYEFTGEVLYRKRLQVSGKDDTSKEQKAVIRQFKQMFLIPKRETVARYIIEGAVLYHYADKICNAYRDLDYYIRLSIVKGSMTISAWGVNPERPDLAHSVTYRDVSNPPGKDGDVILRGLHLKKMKTAKDLELVILKSKVIILTERMDSVSMPVLIEKNPALS
jgi:hypothetical protein